MMVVAMPVTDPSTFIFQKQLSWAQRRGIELCGSAGDRGRLAYTRRLDDNLFEPLAPEARAEYTGGDGGELGRDVGRPGKMHAIHSSSALGCNMFHYWRRVDPAGIVSACGLPESAIDRFVFEGRLPISGMFRYAPNLDVLVTYGGDAAVAAIECKFSEPFSTRGKLPLSAKYLDCGLDELWEPMPALRSVAERCADPSVFAFVHLDAAQLLKHLLGLKRRCVSRGYLLYLYYDVPGPAGDKHVDEISRFADSATRDGVEFLSLSHQTLLGRLADRPRTDAAWVDYMTDRYL